MNYSETPNSCPAFFTPRFSESRAIAGAYGAGRGTRPYVLARPILS